MSNELHQWLCGCVRRSGLRQVDFAEQLDISQKHMSQIMNGVELGSLALWDQILRLCGIEFPTPEGDKR